MRDTDFTFVRKCSYYSVMRKTPGMLNVDGVLCMLVGAKNQGSDTWVRTEKTCPKKPTLLL